MLLTEVKKSLGKLPAFKKVIVGVSGGADSVVLAHMLKKLGYDVTIAHLNHGLRGKESDADAKFVRDLAQKWDVTFVTCKVKLPKKGNLENEGRKIRYGFLEKVRQSKNAKFIAVAHHLDDQIETILMHMYRGAGLRGMMGMSLQTGNIIRPLLTVSKKEILDYAKQNKLEFRTDSSNLDTNFRRNYLRHIAIPKLRKKDPRFEKKLIALSGLAQRRMVIIEKQALEWIKKYVSDDRFSKKEFSKLTGDLQSEIIFSITGRNDVYRKNINDIKRLITDGITGNQITISDITFRNEYENTVFYPFNISKGRDLKKIRLSSKKITWGPWKIKYRGEKEIYVRNWKSGDRFEPSGMGGSKKLQDYFTDCRIPKTERHQIPIIVDKEDKVLGIANFRVAKGADFLKQCLQIVKM